MMGAAAANIVRAAETRISEIRPDDSRLAQLVQDPARLEALQATQLLDTPPEEIFDRAARLASHLMHAPVALVSLVDKDRQFFKSQFGLKEPLATARQTPLSHSFCKHLVGTSEPLVVPDARSNPVLKNSAAIRDNNVIAYLGVPLQTPEGQTLGSLCTIDEKPRHWSEEDVGILTELGAWVMTEIQLRMLARHFLSSYVKLRDVEMQRDELTHMLVHDLRNPLNSLMMGLQLVKTAPALDEKASRYIDIAQGSAESLLRMISDILDVSKSEAGRLELDLESVAPAEVVNAACDQVEAMARKTGVTIIRDAEMDLPAIRADREKLRRVLVNLLSNALQHTAHPGTVKISARRSQDLRDLVLSVSDTGTGMAPEIFGRIFEKYGQCGPGKPGRLSTGLGLPFCKKAIEAHGGQIQVESELGRGTTFRINLPY